MSLENIQLPPIVLQTLFNKTLVDLNASQPIPELAPSASFTYLGENKKRIVLITKSSDAIYLPDNSLNFLIGILGACQLTMADVALLNVMENPGIHYSGIEENLKAEKIILFGVAPGEIELPLKFPDYQIQSFNNQIYLSAASLDKIAEIREEKVKLWNSLKKVFNIA